MLSYWPLDVVPLATIELSDAVLVCERSETVDPDVADPEPWNDCDAPTPCLGLQVRPGRWRAFRDERELARLLLVHEDVTEPLARLFERAVTVGALQVEGGSAAVVDAELRDDPRIVDELTHVHSGAADLFGRGVRIQTGGDGDLLISTARGAEDGEIVAIDLGSQRIDTRWITGPTDRAYEELAGWSYATRFHPDDTWPTSVRDLLGYLDAAALTDLCGAIDEAGELVTAHGAPLLRLADALPTRGPLPADVLAFASALLARTEQPGLCLASLRSPADPGAEVLFVCAPFEVDGLRRAGHDVTSG